MERSPHSGADPHPLRGGTHHQRGPVLKTPHGELRLDELITREYTHDEINKGYTDMLEGRNIRGVISF